MKKLIVVAFLFIATFAKAQNTLDTLSEVDGKVVYERIVDISNKSKDFIFTAANNWMLDSFSGKTGGILSQDKEQGQIVGRVGFVFHEKGTFFHPAYNWMYIFNIQIDCKDNKFRIRLYNMQYGVDLHEKDLVHLEFYNYELKNSKTSLDHENAYTLDAKFKAVMQSLADAVIKAAKDDF